MRSPKIKQFIKQNKVLFWYTPAKAKENISDELLMEMILNYADLKTIQTYLGLMGPKKAKLIFQNFKGRKKGNIYPEIYHLFTEYFKQFA